jgi:Flp pilus assembly protein TadD
MGPPTGPSTLEAAAELHRSGQLEAAQAIYRQILNQNPADALALHGLGATELQLGRISAAEALIRRAISLDPNVAAFHANLGLTLMAQNRPNEAVEAFRSAIRLEPNVAETHNELGVALHAAGQSEAASAAYRTALALRPDYSDALNNLGVLLQRQDRIDESIENLCRSVQLDPNNATAHNNLGNSLRKSGRLDEAIASYQSASRLRPNDPRPHNNLGNVFKARGDLDQAVHCYQQAIALADNSFEPFNNLGAIFAEMRRTDQALECFREAIQRDPNNAEVHWNLAFQLLAAGQFAEGWEEFEWRLKYQALALGRDFAAPRWNGQDLAGKTLLLHTEGGFGDAIQFIRYVPLLAGRAAKLVLESQPELVRLFSTVLGIHGIVPRGLALSEFDFHLSLLSLPRLFKTDLSNIPAAVPYLSASPADQSHWAARLTGHGRLKVGLAWAGSPRRISAGEYRTRNLDVFSPLAKSANVEFFSLQKGPESNQPRPPGLHLTDFTADIRDFADMATLIQHLDLVISVDTSVAHLAGALAKPVWVLIPFDADFRWLLDRPDSPWYPTMRLFRQPTMNDWQTPVAQIVEALGIFESEL